MIPVIAWVMLSATLFSIGVWGVITQKNAIRVLMCVEMLLNSANINFVAFGAYHQDNAGTVFTFFSITLAAAEATVGLAIFLNLYRHRSTVSLDSVHSMRW